MGKETTFAQFRENKYGIFDWKNVNATFLKNLVQNPES